MKIIQTDLSKEFQYFNTDIIKITLVKIFIFMMEFCIYWSLFKSKKEQNEKIKHSLSKKCLNRRYKKNAISLKAQSIAFAVESGFYIFLMIFQFKMIGEEFKPYLIFQIGIFTNALSNIALFVAFIKNSILCWRKATFLTARSWY